VYRLAYNGDVVAFNVVRDKRNPALGVFIARKLVDRRIEG
jgi:hypothetical protein